MSKHNVSGSEQAGKTARLLQIPMQYVFVWKNESSHAAIVGNALDYGPNCFYFQLQHTNKVLYTDTYI